MLWTRDRSAVGFNASPLKSFVCVSHYLKLLCQKKKGPSIGSMNLALWECKHCVYTKEVSDPAQNIEIKVPN